MYLQNAIGVNRKMISENFMEINTMEILRNIWVYFALPVIMQPIFFALLCSAVAGFIVKGIIGKIVYDFSMVAFCTKKEARRNAKLARDTVSLISAAKDFNSRP
jgi:hypothetical protein